MYYFADEGEQEGIEEGVAVPAPAHELVFEYVGQHLLGLTHELLTELELLPHKHLYSRESHWHPYRAVLLPFLHCLRECGDGLVGDNDVELFGVVGQGGYLVEIFDLSDIPADELVGGVAVVVAHLIHPPAALARRYHVAGQRSGQHSFLKAQ